MTIGTDPSHSQLMTKEQVIEKTHQESLDALKDPYVFPKPIKQVAVIGAGPAGVSSVLLLTCKHYANVNSSWLQPKHWRNKDWMSQCLRGPKLLVVHGAYKK